MQHTVRISVSRQAEVKAQLPAFGLLFNTHTFSRPFITEISLMGRKESNQTNTYFSIIIGLINVQIFLPVIVVVIAVEILHQYQWQVRCYQSRCKQLHFIFYSARFIYYSSELYLF